MAKHNKVGLSKLQLLRLDMLIHQTKVYAQMGKDRDVGRETKSDFRSSEQFLADTVLVYIRDSYDVFTAEDKKAWQAFSKAGDCPKSQRTVRALTELLESLR
jgi:hypothetical protein